MVFEISEQSDHSDDYIFGKPEFRKKKKGSQKQSRAQRMQSAKQSMNQTTVTKQPRISKFLGPQNSVKNHLVDRVQKFSRTK